MTTVRLMLHRPLTAVRPLRAPAAAPDQAMNRRVLDPIGDRHRLEDETLRATQELVERIALTVEQVRGLVEARIEEASAFVVELGLGLAAQVLRQEIDQGRYDAVPAVQECIRSAVQSTAAGSVLVYLNPEDLSHVLGALEEAGQSLPAAARFEIDPGLPRGGCRVETSVGQILHHPEAVLQAAMARVREEALR